MANDVNIDDMINARQQMQPGFKKANPKAGPGINYANQMENNMVQNRPEPQPQTPAPKQPAPNTNYMDYLQNKNANAPAGSMGQRAKGVADDVKGMITNGALGDQYPDARNQTTANDMGKYLEEMRRIYSQNQEKQQMPAPAKTLAPDAGTQPTAPSAQAQPVAKPPMMTPAQIQQNLANDLSAHFRNYGLPDEPVSGQQPVAKPKTRLSFNNPVVQQRADNWNNRHIFKSEGTDIDGMLFANQFEKGGQPVTPFKGRDQLTQDEYDKEYEALKDEGLDEYDRAAFADDAAWLYNNDHVKVGPNSYKTVPSPRPAIDAWRNKQAAIAADAASDSLKASDPEGEKTESEEKITEDEVQKAGGAGFEADYSTMGPPTYANPDDPDERLYPHRRPDADPRKMTPGMPYESPMFRKIARDAGHFTPEEAEYLANLGSALQVAQREYLKKYPAPTSLDILNDDSIYTDPAVVVNTVRTKQDERSKDQYEKIMDKKHNKDGREEQAKLDMDIVGYDKFPDDVRKEEREKNRAKESQVKNIFKSASMLIDSHAEGLQDRGLITGAQYTEFMKAGGADDLSTYSDMARQYALDNFKKERQDSINWSKHGSQKKINKMYGKRRDDAENARQGEKTKYREISQGIRDTDATEAAKRKNTRNQTKKERNALATELKDAYEGDLTTKGEYEAAKRLGTRDVNVPGMEDSDYSAALHNGNGAYALPIPIRDGLKAGRMDAKYNDLDREEYENMEAKKLLNGESELWNREHYQPRTPSTVRPDSFYPKKESYYPPTEVDKLLEIMDDTYSPDGRIDTLSLEGAAWRNNLERQGVDVDSLIAHRLNDMGVGDGVNFDDAEMAYFDEYEGE